MSTSVVRRTPVWFFICAGLIAAAHKRRAAAPPPSPPPFDDGPSARLTDDAKRADQQFLALHPGSKLADGVQKKLAVIP